MLHILQCSRVAILSRLFFLTIFATCTFVVHFSCVTHHVWISLVPLPSLAQPHNASAEMVKRRPVQPKKKKKKAASMSLPEEWRRVVFVAASDDQVYKQKPVTAGHTAHWVQMSADRQAEMVRDNGNGYVQGARVHYREKNKNPLKVPGTDLLLVRPRSWQTSPHPFIPFAALEMVADQTGAWFAVNLHRRFGSVSINANRK